tara:strand:+ start:22704 stop:23621 length:918 start_codon:yes stop_codon:yes gene_type:complete
MRVLKKLKEENLIFFDIETASVVKQLELDTPLFDSWAYKVNKKGELSNDEVIESYSKGAGLHPEFAKVVSIVVGKIVKGKIYLITLDHDSEADLLQEFNKTIERNVKCNLVGFVNNGFDTPFVYRRMVINGIEPHDKLDVSGLKPWEIDHIDLALEWKSSSFERASLINVATAFGLPSPKDDISGADVAKTYWSEGRKGLDRISAYCRKDVITTINIFKKMRLEEPLEAANDEPAPVVEDDLITKLFNGGQYGAAEKKGLKALIDAMSEDEQDKALEVLNAMTSTAKAKKTKITKAHVRALKAGK